MTAFAGDWVFDTPAATTTADTTFDFSSPTDVPVPVYTASPIFDLDDWETRRIEEEKKRRESNSLHLSEKRKDLFRKNDRKHIHRT